MVAFVTDLLASNRVLLEKISFRQMGNSDSKDNREVDS